MIQERSLSIPTKALALLLLAAALPTGSISAQWYRLLPSDPASPYWWTLSDQVSPAELRRALQEPEAHRERFRNAVRAGKLPGAGEGRADWVRNYVESAELVPMWQAFSAYDTWFHRSIGYPEAPHDLREYGLSEEGAERIVDEIDVHDRRLAAITAETQDQPRQFAEMLARAGIVNPDHLGTLSPATRDLIVQATNVSPEQVEKLHSQWRRSPLGEAAVPSLVSLRADLTAADWSAFRTFLLKEVAPYLTGLELKDPAPTEEVPR